MNLLLFVITLVQITFFKPDLIASGGKITGNNVEMEIFYNNRKVSGSDTLNLSSGKTITLRPTRFRNDIKNVIWSVSIIQGNKIKKSKKGQGFVVDISQLTTSGISDGKIVLEIIKLEGPPYSPVFNPTPKVFNLYITKK